MAFCWIKPISAKEKPRFIWNNTTRCSILLLLTSEAADMWVPEVWKKQKTHPDQISYIFRKNYALKTSYILEWSLISPITEILGVLWKIFYNFLKKLELIFSLALKVEKTYPEKNNALKIFYILEESQISLPFEKISYIYRKISYTFYFSLFLLFYSFLFTFLLFYFLL